MPFDSVMYAAETGMAEVIGTLIPALMGNVMSVGIGILAYVFTALSLYTIAQRRGIKNPWMAWVPVLNVWILGCISDQYRYVVKGEVRSRRKVLLILNIVKNLGVIAAIAMVIMGFVNLIVHAQILETGSNKAILEFLGRQFMPALGAAILMGVVSLVSFVFAAMAYYDLFASCEPENKVLYLVLGLLINITLPIFLFLCRHKDLGMPAKRAAQPQSEPEVAPMAEAPAEPWEIPNNKKVSASSMEDADFLLKKTTGSAGGFKKLSLCPVPPQRKASLG